MATNTSDTTTFAPDYELDAESGIQDHTLLTQWILTAIVVTVDVAVFLKKLRTDRHAILTFNLVIGAIIHEIGTFSWLYNDLTGHIGVYVLGKHMCMFHVLSFNFGHTFTPVTIATITWHTWVSVFHSDLYQRYVTDRKFLIIVVTPIIVSSILATSLLLPFAPTASAIINSRYGPICSMTYKDWANFHAAVSSTWVIGNLLPTALTLIPVGLMTYSTVEQYRQSQSPEKAAQDETDMPRLVHACVSTYVLNACNLVCFWPIYIIVMSNNWVHISAANYMFYTYWLLSGIAWLLLQWYVASWFWTLIVRCRSQGILATIIEIMVMLRTCDMSWKTADDKEGFGNPSFQAASVDPEAPAVN